MATSAAAKAIEALAISKTKELKGVCSSPVAAPSSISLSSNSLAHPFPLQTEKRDTLIAIEKKYQLQWEEDGVFQSDAPTIEEIALNELTAAQLREKYPKFFGTIAYPYMSVYCLPLGATKATCRGLYEA